MEYLRVANLIYQSKYPSVSYRVRGKLIFSGAIEDSGLIFWCRFLFSMRSMIMQYLFILGKTWFSQLLIYRFHFHLRKSFVVNHNTTIATVDLEATFLLLSICREFYTEIFRDNTQNDEREKNNLLKIKI